MGTVKRSTQRNVLLDLVKLIAACFIVFGHVHIQGIFGEIEDCTTRFTIPIFTAVSGYFSLGINDTKILQRAKGILKYLIITLVIYGGWSFVETILLHGSIPGFIINSFGPRTLFAFFVFNVPPFSEHLWWLIAMVECYILFWMYERFSKVCGKEKTDYTIWYLVSFILFFFHAVLGGFGYIGDLNVGMRVYRNMWFFLLPMFSLGLFIRQYFDQIVEAFNVTARKCVVVIIIGFAASYTQFFCFGKPELPLGYVAVTIAIFFFTFLVSSSVIPEGSTLYKLDGFINHSSLMIYIIHPLYMYIIQSAAFDVPFFKYLCSRKLVEGVVILAITFLTAIVTYIVKIAFSSRKNVKNS